MRYLLVCLLLFAGNICFGQSSDYVDIPGTKCSMIPPDGFALVTNFAGFHNPDKVASIMVNELPSAPYEGLEKAFTAEALKEKGMTLISKKTVNFKSKDATYITLSQKNDGTVFLKQMLMFPGKDGTVMINGIYPEEHKSLEDEMSRAIFTTRYDEGRSENPEDAVPFSIDVKGTDFKHVKYISGMLLYSFEDKMPTNKPILIVGSSIENVTGDREAYARNRIKQLPNGEHNDIKEIKEITIDKLHGYETEAYGKTKDNKQQRIYQVILFDTDGSYYMISAQEQIDFENHLPVFKKVARTFKRK